ncbi:MAG TPA: nuclear transport factor 2 family protein, partial [Candidatus Methylomirabilis sp.]|nr:nuclear transport factor 2 family protein [Candidatus Methylomirabilis sp.]
GAPTAFESLSKREKSEERARREPAVARGAAGVIERGLSGEGEMAKMSGETRRREFINGVAAVGGVMFMPARLVRGTSASFGQAASEASRREADVRELERLETVWNEAHEHGDSSALEALWADDLEVAVPKMPVMRKAEAVAFARSGRMKFLRYATSDIHVRVYGDAAVVTGRLQRTRELNGQEISDDWRFTKMYVREAQKWHVVAFHASEAAQPSK